MPNCTALGLRIIDRARAINHLRPLVLPTNYRRLTGKEQVFVLVNLERIANGVPPLVGLAAPLDASAQLSADRSEDPTLTGSYGSIQVVQVARHMVRAVPPVPDMSMRSGSSKDGSTRRMGWQSCFYL